MRDRYSVIKRPLITEKATGKMETDGKYSFEVDSKANKIEIKRAVEAAFKVSVTKVNVVSMRGKLKRVRWQPGHTPDWKKAVVTLKKGDKIEYTK
ncbi:MAG: 50S ribosomal protein L23 [Candidatus Aureabacteria bacterium]|nr:50S ribosomal protein L23 [Candidatus Auribacterota bacterium]